MDTRLVPKLNRGIFSVITWRCLCFGWVETLLRVDSNINAQIYTCVLRFRQWFLACPCPSFSSWRFIHFLMPQFIGRGLPKKSSLVTTLKIWVIENIWWYSKRKLHQRIHRIISEYDRQDVAKNYVRILYKSIPK